MRIARIALVVLIVVEGLAFAAKVKVRTQSDETFDFTGKRTYAWHPSGAGEVKVMNQIDKPDQIRASVEPPIVQSVEDGLAKLGFTKVTTGAPDFHVFYYVLVGSNTEAQVMGQFLPAVPGWGLPPIGLSTTSLKVVEQGTLVLDVASVERKATVWRGVAEAEIVRANTDEKRAARIREAVAEMLKQFPPKPKKK